MLNISAYYKKDLEQLFETKENLVVNSVGHYCLHTRKRMRTNRPGGREDYQFVYIAKGSGLFLLDGQYITVSEGSLVLFKPGDSQVYQYCLDDKPDVYWIHFSGRTVEEVLESCGFFRSGIYEIGVHSDYISCFQFILRELQIQREEFIPLAALEFNRFCHLARRNILEQGNAADKRNREMEKAIRYFHEAYQKEISIETYAGECNMSVCWFIRRFKEYTGLTPQRFITDLRITKARELLRDQSFSVGEVAEIVGYANPLYFSRIFKQYTGVMPSRYGKGIKDESNV